MDPFGDTKSSVYPDIRIETDSLHVSNLNPPPCWTQYTYILRPGPFRYASQRRRLTEDLLVDRASLSSGSRMVARLDPDALHLGIYSLRGGRFMHVEGPWDDLCSVTPGGGLWEAVVQTESEGMLLLITGPLAKRLLAIVHQSTAYAVEPQQGGKQSLVHVPCALTRQLALRIDEAFGTDDEKRRLEIAGALPAIVEALLADLVPLTAELPPPRSRRRMMALEYEHRIWDALPLKGSMPDVDGETCAALGLTRRSLQLAVREHFGMSCEALQRTIRLNYAHLLLSDGSSARNVTDAALAAGFTHAGRFSQDYRTLFGRKPSATLAASGSRP